MITMNPAVVERVVRWSMTILEKSPIYQEILQKGVEEGRQSSLRTLKRILHERLGPAPLGLIERLDKLTVSQLETVTVEAAKAPDWTAFLQRLEKAEIGMGAS